MRHRAHLELTRTLIARIQGAPPAPPEAGEIPAEHYLSVEHFARERAGLFARLPQVVALACELREPGACLPVAIAGTRLVLLRGDDGALRGFRNACRHRGTELVSPSEGASRKKALLCPYHGWTYDLRGRLIHVPHVESFCGRERERDALSEVAVWERFGLVFAGLEPCDLDAMLAPLADELEALSLGSMTLFRRSEREVAGNWKSIVDAFLDGYHIRHLHRDTIYRFFVDAASDAERAGCHVRALTARRALVEQPSAEAVTDLRQVATPSYLLFPNTILILHTDYLSVIVAEPLAAGRTRFVHSMLIPEPPDSPEREEHWRKSFQLIDEGVFLAEDLRAVEAVQRGLETGANPSVLFGAHERPVLWFHRELKSAITGSADPGADSPRLSVIETFIPE